MENFKFNTSNDLLIDNLKREIISKDKEIMKLKINREYLIEENRYLKIENRDLRDNHPFVNNVIVKKKDFLDYVLLLALIFFFSSVGYFILFFSINVLGGLITKWNQTTSPPRWWGLIFWKYKKMEKNFMLFNDEEFSVSPTFSFLNELGGELSNAWLDSIESK